jgi:hypothetical protein
MHGWHLPWPSQTNFFSQKTFLFGPGRVSEVGSHDPFPMKNQLFPVSRNSTRSGAISNLTYLRKVGSTSKLHLNFWPNRPKNDDNLFILVRSSRDRARSSCSIANVPFPLSHPRAGLPIFLQGVLSSFLCLFGQKFR